MMPLMHDDDDDRPKDETAAGVVGLLGTERGLCAAAAPAFNYLGLSSQEVTPLAISPLWRRCLFIPQPYSQNAAPGAHHGGIRTVMDPAAHAHVTVHCLLPCAAHLPRAGNTACMMFSTGGVLPYRVNAYPLECACSRWLLMPGGRKKPRTVACDALLFVTLIPFCCSATGRYTYTVYALIPAFYVDDVA